MSVFIDKKYVSLLSPKLEQFKQKSEYLWNFRCPVCGDSRKNKLKARGYVYRKKSNLFFMCHNCNASISFANLIKSVDRALYDEYVLESFKNQTHGNTPKPDFSFVKNSNPTKKFIENKIVLPTVDENNEAKAYLENRKIPKKYFSQLYYAEDFREFVKNIFPDYEKELYKNEKRIVIPFYDRNNILIGFQGRSILNSKIKYITIKLSEDYDKVFGLNTIDFSKKIYVVEGPFDSMFLENSIAMMDSSLTKAKTVVGDYDYVFIFDNEPRNKQIVNSIDNAIKMGYSVCVWPNHIKQKDINEMILNKYSGSEIQSIIDNNTFEDLKARLQFEQWRIV